ncbi:MAG TPA: hypothetical protein VIV11_27665 [Kofleriaceae bacterium]
MNRVVPLVLALGLTGCAHKPMTNAQLARSAATVGAAVVLTSALVYAEYRDSGPTEASARTTAALPPK